MSNLEVTEVHCYHASWCHNCPQVWQAFKELQNTMESDSMKFIDVDVESDEGVDFSAKYQVRNVPTILIVKADRVIERITGTRTKNELKRLIEKWK